MPTTKTCSTCHLPTPYTIKEECQRCHRYREDHNGEQRPTEKQCKLCGKTFSIVYKPATTKYCCTEHRLKVSQYKYKRKIFQQPAAERRAKVQARKTYGTCTNCKSEGEVTLV